MKADYIAGNIYHFGTYTGEQVLVELDKPCKRIKNGAETDVILCDDNYQALYVLKLGDEIEFPSIGGYPDRFYIDCQSQTTLSCCATEFGDRINTNYWDEKIVE